MQESPELICVMKRTFFICIMFLFLDVESWTAPKCEMRANDSNEKEQTEVTTACVTSHDMGTTDIMETQVSVKFRHGTVDIMVTQVL